MPSKPFRWAVTFENPETRPPDTVRGQFVAATLRQAASRAVQEATKRKTSRGYTSVVILIEVDRQLVDSEDQT